MSEEISPNQTYLRKLCVPNEIILFSGCSALQKQIIFNIQGGVYLVNFLNVYGPGLAILFVVFVEAAGVFWFYGVGNFSKDIEEMIGHKPGIYWRVCWTYISPTFLLVIYSNSAILPYKANRNATVDNLRIFSARIWQNVGWRIHIPWLEYCGRLDFDNVVNSMYTSVYYLQIHTNSWRILSRKDESCIFVEHWTFTNNFFPIFSAFERYSNQNRQCQRLYLVKL